MYTLRTVKKSERMNHFNVSLGESYHLIDRHSQTYNELRNRYFGAMGFSEQEIANYNNPFVVGHNYSLPIYLDNGFEYYIMTESGKTFENLSGLVGDEAKNSIACAKDSKSLEDNINKYFQDLNNHSVVAAKLYRIMNPNGKKDVPSFAYEKVKVWHTEWLSTTTDITFFDWCLINKCKIVDATVFKG
jgi:hypothetical protein